MKSNSLFTWRFIRFVLAICMLATGVLAGCANNGNNNDNGGNGVTENGKGNAATGRYVEEALMQLEGATRLFDAFLSENGDIVFFSEKTSGGNNVVTRSVVSGNGTLESAEIGWLNDLIATGGTVMSVSENAVGTVYALYIDEEYKTKLVRSADGETFEPIDVPGWNTESGGGVMIRPGSEGSSGGAGGQGGAAQGGMMGGGAQGGMGAGTQGGTMGGRTGSTRPSGVIALEDGFLILSEGKGAAHYSVDGSLIREYPGVGKHGSVDVYNGQLAIVDMESRQISLYDLATGNKTEAFSYDGLGETTFIGMDDSGLFVADASGISRRETDGWEMIVDGGLTSLMMPNLPLSQLVIGSNDDFYAFLGVKDYQLMRYAYSADVSAEPDTVLEVFSLYDNNTIRQAIGEFQRQNPNVRVDLRVAMDEDSSATAEDVIRALNTELLAGKGPDIIVLDGLPISSYIDKGVLKDITDLTSRLTNELGLLENLTDAYEKNGKTYGLPSRFVLPVMLGKQDKLDSIRSLSDLAGSVEAGQNEEIPLFRASDSLWKDEGMLMEYYEACVDNWTREDGSIDEAGLAAFLKDMLRLDKTLKEHTPQTEGGKQIFMGSPDVGIESIDLGSWDVRDGKAQVHIQTLIGVMGLRDISRGLGSKPDMGFESLFEEYKYYPRGGVGVVAAGGQQELSEAFVEMLLSQTVQDKYLYDGFPVNGLSLQKMTEETLEADESLSDMGFVEISGKLNKPVFADQVVKEAVQAQIRNLLSGAVTPGQAAAKIVESTRLYLAE